jgi:hypothetical protein
MSSVIPFVPAFSMQPEPLTTVVIHSTHVEGQSTTIARIFAPGEANRCRLCRECHINPHGLCMIAVPAHIPDEETRLFSLTEWERAQTEEGGDS